MVAAEDRDLRLGAATLALSGAYCWVAVRIPESQLADAIGPRALPVAYAILLGTFSSILVIRSLARSAGAAAQNPAARSVSLARMAGMLGIGVAYVVAAPWLGYFLSLTGLIFATVCYQGRRIDRYAAIVAVCGALVCWVIFVLIMGIPQPRGVWPRLP
jgi:hypothetical protein